MGRARRALERVDVGVQQHLQPATLPLAVRIVKHLLPNASISLQFGMADQLSRITETMFEVV